MNNVIKVGVGVLIINDGKVLLGHRNINQKDTGGIYEPDSWTLPGGKQEYDETIIECAKREVKEETNLDVDDIIVFCAADDVSPGKHYITIHTVANKVSGDLLVMEPDKIDEWRYFSFDELPENVYSPSRKTIDAYLERMK